VLVVAAKASGLDQGTLAAVMERHGLQDRFTPEELRFLSNSNPPHYDLVRFSWRIEAAIPLFWALGYVDHLGLPTEPGANDPLVEALERAGMPGLIQNAKYRPVVEVLDEADLIYRCHWAVRNEQLAGRELTTLHPGVTQERHYALNWLIRYGDQEWDDMSTDT
jgi:hypothetical protein